MAQREIGQLRTRLSWEDEGATRSLTRFRDDMKGLRSEMRTITSQGKDYSNSLKGLKQQSDVLSRQYRTQQERVRELNKRYQESVKVKGEDNKQTRELSTQYNNAVSDLNRLEGQLERVNAEIQRMESPWTQLGDTMTSTGERMQDIGRSMTDFGKAYSMRVTAPIVAGGVAMFKASMDYESAFAGVRKTVDATEEEFQSLSDGIREMAKELPASATEIAAVGEAAGQLGIETDNILEFTRTMIDLGEATNMTADTAATEFARFANIVGMSQKDFDRLGSVVVDLGNNLATTEAEIVSMAMRLAGAGAQIGLTEAEIMGFSAALSSVGIEAEAGGSAFSKVMVNMQLAAERGGDELKAFADVAGMSADDFKKAFEEDAAGAMITFIEGLATAEERGLSAIGILDEMGITEVRMRDALLRAAGASDVFTDAISMGSKAWEENTALTEEAAERYATTESQLRIMWNRVKDVAISLGNALVPAVMDVIDAAEPLIRKIEEGAQAFADMDEEQQRTILKMAGLVAAVGPASIALGGLITTLGGVLTIGGTLSTALGTAKGAGLLAKFAGLGMSGPVGLAVAGVAALTGVVYFLTRDIGKLHDVNYELIDSIDEEVESIRNLEDRFVELHNKSQLTADEMLRYMDIMTELGKADSEESIRKLTDEQQKLLEKSGLTNEEMEEFLSLNNQIVEETPNVTSAISDQGNAFIDNLEILKDLNAEKIESLMLDAQRELEKALENENQLLIDQKNLESEIKDIREEINSTQQERLDKMQELGTEELKQEEINRRIASLKEEMETLDGEALRTAEASLYILELEKAEQDGIVEAIGYEKQELDRVYDKLLDKLKTKNDDLDTTREELEEIQNMIGDYETLVLKQVGLNSERGRGLDVLDRELGKLDKQQKELDELHRQGKLVTSDYEEQNGKLSTQRQRLLDAQKELREINKLAGETIYDKEIRLKLVPSVRDINREIGASVTKRVNILSDGRPQRLAYATGTNHHPGGEFIAGEAGWELGRLGSRWEVLNAGLYNRPAGYEVFTHDESKRILGALNRLPGYATGTNMGAETNRIVNSMNNDTMGDSGQVVALLRDIAQGVREGKVVHVSSHVITDAVNETNAVNDLGKYF